MTTQPLANFEPLVGRWFADKYGAPTDVQTQSWPRIAAGEHLLITAPTGSGKTLTAFLWALNTFAAGRSEPNATRVLYLSPLKALNNDIRRNLQEPLRELQEIFAANGRSFPPLRVQTRSGDTAQDERQRMLRRPPELLVTTPESLMLLLTTVRGRQALSTVETVILDEIHSIVDNRRGVQLLASLERLVEVAGEFQRVALSATVRPLQTVAQYVAGADRKGVPRPIGIVQSKARKDIHFEIRFPEEARAAAKNGKQIWDPLSDSFKDVIESNRSTLFFTNSRRMAEKITLKLNQDAVGPVAYAHHGSLAREIRTEVESRLKQGELKAIVATNSLEMGIDIGDLDEVVLIQSPPSLASALQRVGRSGHNVGDVSRGLLFPTHAQDFLEAAVVAKAMQSRDIEPLTVMQNPLDVLAQIIVSTVAHETWNADQLYQLLRRSGPYRSLLREHFDLVVEMLAGRYAGTRVRDLKPRVAYDRLDNTLNARKGAVFALYNSGGTIPDRGYFTLRHADSGAAIGELDEEFVWEATIGDTFTLGTQNWRVHRITHNDVLVKAAPPKATAPPFWRAEAYNRSFHFSTRIGEFLEFANERLAAKAADQLTKYAQRELGFDAIAAAELVDYLADQRDATSRDLPHHHHVLVEHVSSGPAGYTGPDREQQIVIHTTWGGRVNRPFALALQSAWRDRFEAVADVHADNYAIVVQIKDDVDPALFMTLVTPANFRALLHGSLEGSGFFGARFRECAGRALLLTRQRFNQRMPLWMSRMQAKKLLTAVKKLDNFPVLLETWRTCLNDEFDMTAAEQVLADIESGTIAWSVAQTSVPSPFAANITFNQVGRYMYADDTPEQQGISALSDDLIRQAVFDQSLRPQIDPEIVGQFESKAQRTAPGYAPTTTAELGEWLKERVLIPEAEWQTLLHGSAVEVPDTARQLEHHGRSWHVHRENLRHVERTLLGREVSPDVADARDAGQLVAEFAAFYGPRTLDELAVLLPVEHGSLHTIVQSLVDDQTLVAGQLLRTDSRDATEVEFCDSDNLETLLRFQRAARRPAFEARPMKQLPGFLAAWQRFGVDATADRLLDTIDQLRGYSGSIQFWLEDAFTSRLVGYNAATFYDVCAHHDVSWRGTGRESVTLGYADELTALAPASGDDDEIRALFADPNARYTFLQLADRSPEPMSEFNDKFWQAVWDGQVTADDVQPLAAGAARKFQLGGADASAPAARARRLRARARNSALGWPGNWRLTPLRADHDPLTELETAKDRCRVLLDRYGVVTRELANREGGEFRWAALFRALRIMELSGEIVAGLFFEGFSGPQFILPLALRQLERLDREATFWVNATDPVAPTGLGLEWPELPQRRTQNYLGFHSGELAMIVENNGKRLVINLDPDAPELDELCAHLAPITDRQRRLSIDTINGAPAAKSPYLTALGRHLNVTHDHRGVYLERSRNL